MPRIGQESFSKGEVTPELLGRKDLAAYKTSLPTARNVEVLQRGGIRNRAGLKFLGPVGDHTKKVRLFPFVYGSTDTHILEFGDQYIRFMREDAHITESAQTITGATQADPVELTISGHGLSTGDEIFISSVGGMTELNNKRFLVTNTGANTITLQDQVTGNDVDGTGYTTYTSGGTASRIYQISSPYTEDELFDIKYDQSFDVVFLTHPEHPPKKLERSGLASWSLSDVEFSPEQSAPTGLSGSASVSGGATVRYMVTAIAEGTEEESIGGLAGSTSFTITAITQANPAKITISSSTSILQTGHEIEITGVNGMTELNGRRYRVLRVSGTEFELQGIDSTSFSAYTSSGTATPAFATVTSSKEADDSALENSVSWTAVNNAFKYAVYRELNGIFGYVGETRDTSYSDKGTVSPDLSDTAPAFRDPFFGEDNYPAAIGGHQQRNIFGGSDNSPAVFNASQTGAFNNFSSSSPRRETDSFQAAIAARSREKIRHFASLNDLLVFTDRSIKRVSSGEQSFAFENISIRGPDDSEVGSSQVAPLINKRQVLFEDARGGRVYSAQFSFSIDDLDIVDISIFSPHLLDNDRIKQRAKVPLPEPIIYYPMESGRCLSLTYNKETDSVDISGWCRWDTKGFFESVAAVRPDISASSESAYFIVNRTVDGNSVRYIEKLEDRRDEQDIRDSFFVDSGLSYENSYDLGGVSAATPSVFTSTGHGLDNDDLVEVSGIVWKSKFDKDFNEVFPEDLNYKRYRVRNKTTNTFNLEDVDTGDLVDGASLPTYESGGKVYKTATELFGYEHMRGETLVGLLDGNVVRDLSVSSLGKITLPRAVARAHIGIPYISDLETLPLIEERQGVGSGEIKSLRSIFVKVLKSRGMLIGPDKNSLREWPQRQYEKLGEPTQRLTGVVKLHPQGTWDRNGQVFIRQKDPLPLTVLEIRPDVELA